MAEIFDFYVNDNRTITFKLTEPIMLEDNGVSDWRFHIPNTVNGLDATGWAWWLVYVNAKNEKYTIPLTLEYDYDRPDAYSIATYTVDYGMSCKVGNIRFSLEAIDADTGGTILHEWHTKTYSTNVVDTLQGNQAEYAETESDIISALLIEVRNRTNQLIGGATPEPKNLIADMIDPDKVYLYVGSEPDESTGYWYYHNGTRFVPGGVYGAGVVDPVPTQGSTNAVSSGGVHEALAGKVDAETGKGLSTNDYSDTEKQKVTDATADLSAITTATAEDAGKALKAKTVTNGKVVEWEFGEAGGADTEAITNRFEKLYADGSGGFDSALFVNGGMSSGIIIYGQKYRVTSNELFSFTRDVTISAQDGYRFGAHIFVDGAFDRDTGWKTSLDVSAGTTFKIVIAKQTEDTSVVADIDEFVNMVDISTFVSDTRKQVEQLDEELTGEITDLQSEIDKIKNQSLPASVASAILQTLKGVAWASENGGQMINALHDALFGGVGKSYTFFDYITPTADHPFRNASGIATAVDFDPTCSIETTILYTNSVKTKTANILGSKTSAGVKCVGLFATPSTGKLGYWYLGKDTVNNITPLSANQKTTISIKPVGVSETYPDNAVIDVDGTEYNSGVTVKSYDCPSWLGFFNYTLGDEINANGVMYDIGLKIGRTIVRSANGVMRNCFIPAHDGTRYGLYDSMHDRFFYNETYADKYTCGYWE